MQAVILAAGEGTRLRPLTGSRPKAMIPIANRPIIGYVIDSLVKNGIRDIIIVIGYRKEQVSTYLNQLDIPVTVVVQDRQLGTAHALKAAEKEIREDFLLLPGDNYIDPRSIARIKGEKNAMLVKEHPSPSNFGVVVISGERIVELVEKPELAPTHTVSTGIFSLQKDFIQHLNRTEIPDVIGCMLKEGFRMKAVYAENWQDAIYPWDILKLNAQLIKGTVPRRGGTLHGSVTLQGPVSIGNGTTIGPNTAIFGPAVIGDDCRIGPNCCIMPQSSIGSRVEIEPFSLIGNSLFMDDTRIGSHSRISDMVVGSGCVLSDHTTSCQDETIFEIDSGLHKARFGAILGDRVRAAPFTVFRNCIVGNNVTIREGRIITGQVPEGVVVV